jgi:hypothetical protein
MTRTHVRAEAIMRRFQCVDIPDDQAVHVLDSMYRRYCDRIGIVSEGVPLGDAWKGYMLDGVLAAATADHIDGHGRIHVTNFVARAGRVGVIGAFVALALYKAAVETGLATDVVGTVHRDNLPMATAMMRTFGNNNPRPLGYVMSWKEA